jgi:signal peptidase II
MKLYGRLLGAAAIVVLFDQITKSWALNALADGPIHVIDDFLSLRITYNSGGAFGVLQGVPGLFLVAGLLIGGLILLWVKNLEEGTWLLPFGIVLGGGLGNVVDRIFRAPGGRVVDFIDIHHGTFQWPLFNVADASIVIGVILILMFGTRQEASEEPRGSSREPSDAATSPTEP